MKTLFLGFKTPQTTTDNICISAVQNKDLYTINIFNITNCKSKTIQTTLEELKDKFTILK